MRRRSLLLVLLLALSVGLVLGSNHVQPHADIYAAPASSKRAHLSQLIASTRTHGSVQVIVGLDIPFAPEGMLASQPQVQAQRTAIASQQQDLLSRLQAYNVRTIRRFTYIPYIALTVDEAALDALSQDPLVTSISRDRRLTPLLDESTTVIGADDAWAAGATGAGWSVAILDTGVDSAHPFLKDKVVAEACFSSNDDPEFHDGIITSACPDGTTEQIGAGSAAPCDGGGCNHGTHVAGIAAGKGTNMSGVAPDASIIAIQVFSMVQSQEICGDAYWAPCVTVYDHDVIKALEHVYALREQHQIAAINLSLGGGEFTSVAACDQEPDLLPGKAIADTLRSVGIATIAAGGNAGADNALAAPACLSNVISVGSTGTNDSVSSFSNKAPFLDLLAPGEAINSSVPGNAFQGISGTSQATPHVAGAWAVLRSVAPTQTVQVDQVLSLLQTSGIPIAERGTNGEISVTPRIQLDSAIEQLDTRFANDDVPTELSAQQTGDNTLEFRWQDNSAQETGYQLEQRQYGTTKTDWTPVQVVWRDTTTATYTATSGLDCTTMLYRVSALERADIYDTTAGGILATSASSGAVCQPQNAAIKGPASGFTDRAYTYAAFVNPTMPVTYTWSPPPLRGQGTSQATYSWAEAGQQTVQVTLHNAAGAVSASQQVAISTPPAPASVSIAQKQSRLAGTGYQYTFAATVTPESLADVVTYHWTPAPAQGQATASATYEWQTLGEYPIQVSVSNAAGTASTIYTATVNGSVSAPALAIPEQVAIVSNTLTLPVMFFANGNTLADLSFDVDYDSDQLAFDASDGNSDNMPDSVTIDGSFIAGVFFDSSFITRELHLDISTSSQAGARAALTSFPDVAEGLQIATIAFTIPANSPLAGKQTVSTVDLVAIRDFAQGGSGILMQQEQPLYLPIIRTGGSAQQAFNSSCSQPLTLPGMKLKDHTLFSYQGFYYITTIQIDRELQKIMQDDRGEYSFGYARTRDFCNWERMGTSLAAERSQDEEYIWAPHVFAEHGTFSLFYTQVNPNIAQSIALATSTNPADPDSWQKHGIVFQPQHEGMVYPWPHAWADARDPMVLKYEDTYYMYYTGQDKTGGIVGLASASNLQGPWSDQGAIFKTPAGVMPESPFVFCRQGTCYLFYNLATIGGGGDGPHWRWAPTPTGPWQDPVALAPGWAHDGYFDGAHYLVSYVINDGEAIGVAPLQWDDSVTPPTPYIP